MAKDYFGTTLSREEIEAKKREREEQLKLNNRRLGLLVFQLSWMMAFIALIIVNWQLRFSYPSWPPPNVKAMGVTLPTIATLALLASAVLARVALRSVKGNQLMRFITQWRTVLGLGGVFVVIMVIEWLSVQMGTQYGTVFRLMTAFHTLHAVAIGAYMFNILRNAQHAQAVLQGQLTNDGRAVFYHAENYWAVEAASRLWDFVFIAWLLFYVVLYWWRS